MQLLNDVIAALCREIDSGLSPERTQLRGRPLDTERVVLSLQVCLKEHTQADGTTKPLFEVLSPESHPANGLSSSNDSHAHRVTLELKPAGSREMHAAPDLYETARPTPEQASPPEAAPIPEGEKPEVTQKLAGVFGEPGFDSSARATVFREVLATLSGDQARSVMDSLRDQSPAGSADAAVQQACHRIANIFRSGPHESESHGGAIFSALMSRYSIASILQLLEQKWKTQDKWMGL